MSGSKGYVFLVADDDVSDVFFLRRALSERCPGCKVIDVADGQDTMDYLLGRGKFSDRKEFPLPTHLFLDIKMPRRNGLEVLRWLRAQKELGQVFVAVLSGSQLESDYKQALSLGASYIVKPVDYDALLGLVGDYLRAHAL